MPTPTLAIDFGTSNSAAAILTNGQVQRVAVEGGADILPTAVFFPANGGETLIGMAATQAFIAGEDGRYMRALKSVLGTSLAHEKRMICGRYRTISTIISEFLATLKKRCEIETEQTFSKVLSGRPVHFHSSDLKRDRQAEEDLRECYINAGFNEVSFLPEPQAAAIVYGNLGNDGDMGLIVDIGGGTSDFTLFRIKTTVPEILANHGIRLGGTDMDHAISMKHAMPELGLGGQLRRPIRVGLLPVPIGPYADLATWSHIPFLYNSETRRMVKEMIRSAVNPEKVSRLGNILEFELGHELAFAVEGAKIEVNELQCEGQIKMDFIASGLSAPVSPDSMNTCLSAMRAQINEAVIHILDGVNVEPAAVNQIILVGGSSLMDFVSREMTGICPGGQLLRSEAFTAVVDGLALATLDRAFLANTEPFCRDYFGTRSS